MNVPANSEQAAQLLCPNHLLLSLFLLRWEYSPRAAAVEQSGPNKSKLGCWKFQRQVYLWRQYHIVTNTLVWDLFFSRGGHPMNKQSYIIMAN